MQHRLQFSGIKKGAKISFHRHFNENVCRVHTKRQHILLASLTMKPRERLLVAESTVDKLILSQHSFMKKVSTRARAEGGST